MKHVTSAAFAVLTFGIAACSPPAAKSSDSAPAPLPEAATGAAADMSCPDDGPRLPGTGICQGRAVNYFDPERVAGLSMGQGELPQGCNWLVNETMTPGENEAILYLALSCNGKTTKLEFSGGARSASLGYGVSGFFEQVPAQGEDGSELVRMFPLEGVPDPKAMILDMARGTAEEAGANAAEIAACELRAAGDGLPSDAYVVDVNDAYKSANAIGPYDDGPKDQPYYGVYGACGPFGVSDAQAFWMIRDGYAWFVDQGQDMPDFSAASLTVFRKSADAPWGTAR